MTRFASRLAISLAAYAAFAPPNAAAHQTMAGPFDLLSRPEEIALARSAAPPHIGDEAAVWVLGADGYEEAATGRNGFHCMVARSHSDRAMRGPQCFDAEAARTVMPLLFEQTRLLVQGLDEAEVETRIAAGIASGEHRPPSRPALAYRQSSAQYLGEQFGAWLPHVRIYVPYLRNDDIGGGAATFRHPFVFGDEGGPFAYMVIVVPDRFDP